MMNLILAGTVSFAMGFSELPETRANDGTPMTVTSQLTGDESVTQIDARAFWDALVARYRGLVSYSDLTNIVQITREQSPSADDSVAVQEVHQIESRIRCDIFENELRITTPGMQLGDEMRRKIAECVKIRAFAPASDQSDEPEQSEPVSEETADLSLRYRLWLAPHMALRFAREPLEELRPGASSTFTATEASEIVLDERPMVHLELAGRSDTEVGARESRIDLYVDPKSMLIERIETKEQLPDGGSFETLMTIVPTSAEGEMTSPAPAEDERESETPASPLAPASLPVSR